MNNFFLSTQVDNDDDDDDRDDDRDPANTICLHAANDRICSFVKKFEIYKCTLCLGVADQPVRCSLSCKAVFCSNCIKEWSGRQSDNRCPVCRGDATYVSDNYARGMIEEQEIYCVNIQSTEFEINKRKRKKNQGCQWIGRLDMLTNHLKECYFETIPCPSDGCDEILERRQMPSHIESCEHVLVNCNNCNDPVKKKDHDLHHEVCRCEVINCICLIQTQRQDMQKHIELDCPLTYIQCPVQGCEIHLMRKDLSNHAEVETARHVQILCDKIVVTDSHLIVASDETGVLDKRISSFETVLKEQQQTIQSLLQQQQQQQQKQQQQQLQLQQLQLQLQEGNKNSTTSITTTPVAGRTYLNVPFPMKEEVKGLGARWDNDLKKWYTVPGHHRYNDIINVEGVTLV